MGYEIYGLRGNPFPKGLAILNPESPDPRENGSIFSVNARAKEIEEFEGKFVGTKTALDDRYRCGLLWAEGDNRSGRGMGKTALSIYIKHRVNDEYGKNYFGGKEKFFCSYISFREEIKSKIAFLYKEALRSFINEGLFLHISSCVSKDNLVKAGVSEDFAEAVANNSVKDYLESLSKYRLEEMSTAYDQRFLLKLPDLFLNQTVRCLKAAGFEGGILLIDDIERLTDRSTRKEIENFIKDFRIAFFSTGNEASNSNFFTIILTTHLQSSQKISEAWSVAGLGTAIPLVAGGHASVLTRKPDMKHCIDIITQHLKYYRDPAFTHPDEFYPFKKEAIETVIRDCDFHPRRFLSRFNRIITEALSKDVKEITSEFVRTVPEVEEEEPLGIEEL
ncbi:MAG: hypothetical protein DDT42_01787 [candidate division WS2 bacterium]|uniref:ATP-binding protein n=1 Tax=Psychracetigena formicireducens TaxID=2986056 RepID=A0A9E2BHX2_PSYF1|nr:hypothetical protein [Candidatus Psychracetigena formicireducens]